MADLDGNRTVNDDDMDILAGNLGMSGATRTDGDLNGDGLVNTTDFDLMFAQFGLEMSAVS